MAFWVLRQVRQIRCFTLPSPSRNMLIPMEGSWILRSATLAYASVKQLIDSKNSDAKFFAKGLRLPSFEVLDLKAQTRSVERTLLRQRLKCTTGFLKPAKDFQNKASRHCQILFSQNSGKFRKFPEKSTLSGACSPRWRPSPPGSETWLTLGIAKLPLWLQFRPLCSTTVLRPAFGEHQPGRHS